MNLPSDPELKAVCQAILSQDPHGKLVGEVLRGTFDQLYDGQRTGRYSWDRLYKTEKTHCGTLVEINLQRAFTFGDGTDLDYTISGVDVDCKYSQEPFGWMIPPEAHKKICLLLWANDQDSTWKMGIVRAQKDLLGAANRDGKARLNKAGQNSVHWIFPSQELPPNILLQLDPAIVEKIMSHNSGLQRVNELFRNALGLRVGRGVIATVAQQDDYMKRVRGNGGARTALKAEGIIILGQYESHKKIARDLGAPIPEKGESIALRVFPANPKDTNSALIANRWWKIATSSDLIVPAPQVPNPSKIKN